MANAVAYGFESVKDIFLSPAYKNNILIPNIRTAIIESAAEQTRQLNELLGAIAQRVTYPKARVSLGGAGTLQPVDEWGVPVPVRGGSYYEMGFPIQGGATAFGTNRISRAKITVEMLNDMTLEAQRKDTDWLMRHAQAAIFDNVSWTFADSDPTVGSLTVKPLANNDTDTYAFAGGTTGTDQHYFAQAAAITDGANPFSTLNLRTELSEHPENSGPYVAYIPTNLVAAVTALTEHVSPNDANISSSANVDTLTNDGATVQRFGNEVFGYLEASRLWTVEWKRLPDNYIIVVALGSASPVLGMREYPEPSLRGFFPEFFSPDGNKEQTSLFRYAGFGVLNRVGALVLRIGNGAYGIPTGFDAPLAI